MIDTFHKNISEESAVYDTHDKGRWQLSLLKQEEDAALPIISDLYGAP